MERAEEAQAVLSGDGSSRQHGSTGKPGHSPAEGKHVPTSDRCAGARECGEPSKMGKQKTAAAGAPGDDAAKWHRIDWHRARRAGRRLQRRIAQAVKESRWNKVRTWQYLLTRSFHAKLLAVKRVTSNQGRNTPGVDGVLWPGARATWRAAKSLRRRGDKPKPLRRMYIPKKNGTHRPLSMPTLYDRAMQAVYKLARAPVAETMADRNSYGFRVRLVG